MLQANVSNGAVVKRGDFVLCEDGGIVSLAIVDVIGVSDFVPYVSLLIINGRRNELDAHFDSADHSAHPQGSQDNPPVKYVGEGVGYRHISTPDNVTGRRFCFLDEAEEDQLRAHMRQAAMPTTPLVEETIEPEAPTQETLDQQAALIEQQQNTDMTTGLQAKTPEGEEFVKSHKGHKIKDGGN